MALSLYRKYRPATFSDVMGQEHIETTLCNAVRTQSVSHAYLFCGPRGTGKTTTARLLAKALLCEKAPTEEPDGSCLSCMEIAAGIHPDVYELDAASRTGVENVREEIIGRVQFAPTRGAYKIYIIDEVHMLSTAAFNALLKVIEEPPTHVIFVLCTTDTHKVPDTIKSRCQQFEFHRLSEEQISARLQYICGQEGYTAEPEAIALIAQRSAGGMRDAISSLEQIAVFTGGSITFDAAESLLGEVSAEQLFSVSTLLATRDVAGCFAWVASFNQGGTDIAQFTRDLAMHMRNIYVAAVVGESGALAELINSDAEVVRRYIEQAELFGSADRLAHVLTVLGELSTQLRYAANSRLALEIALTRIARPDSDLTLEALAARVALLEQGSGLGAAVDASAARVALPEQGSPKVVPAVGGVEAVPAAASVAKPATASVVAPVAAPAAATTPTVAPKPAPAAEPAPTPVAAPVTEPAPAPVAAPTSSAAAATQSIDAQNAQQVWSQVIKELQAGKKHSLVASLGGSTPLFDAARDLLVIELPASSGFAMQNLERAENKEVIVAALTKVCGAPVALSYKLGSGSGKIAPTSQAPPTPVAESAAAPAPTPQNTPPEPATTPEPPAPPTKPAPATPPAPATTDEAADFGDLLSNVFGTDVSVDAVDTSQR